MKGEVKQINGKRVATPEYRSWQMMKNRCLNSCAQDFRFYGGRGIGIFAPWLIYDNFLRDMGRRPTKHHTLERRNVNMGYEPENCYWATRTTQARNRNYVKITFDTAERIRQAYKTGLYTQKEIARHYCVSQRTISLITRHESWKEVAQ